MSINKLSLEPIAFSDLSKPTGNIYDSINIIAERADALNTQFKDELDELLAEFGAPMNVNDTSYLEERASICKSAEAEPKPYMQAIDEFLAGELDYSIEGDEEGE